MMCVWVCYCLLPHSDFNITTQLIIINMYAVLLMIIR